MLKSNKILSAVYNQIVPSIEKSLKSGNYTNISSSMHLILIHNTIFNQSLSLQQDKIIQRLVEHYRVSRCHGFLQGTMGVTSLLLNVYEITGDSRYKEQALELSYTFLEYLSNNLSLNTGVSGTLVGYLRLHSLLKEDWILDDISLYINYLIDSLVISKFGLMFNKQIQNKSGLVAELNTCFVFIVLGKYLNNKVFLNLAIDLYKNETYKFSFLLNHVANSLFWDNWHFSYGTISMLLYRATGQEKYLFNFNKTTTLLMKRIPSFENQIHLLHFLRLTPFKSAYTQKKSFGRILLEIEEQKVWNEWPLQYGNILIAYSWPSYFKKLNDLIPSVLGKVAPKKNIT